MEYKKVENIFDFATKELSQDAFFKWIVANWNCEDKSIRDTAAMFITRFTGGDPSFSFDNVRSIGTPLAQVKHTDITFEVMMKSGERRLFVIEDKIDTSMRENQRIGYVERIKEANHGVSRYHFVYLKTGVIESWERHYVERERIDGNSRWTVIDLAIIFDVLESIKEPCNPILSAFKDHIAQRRKQVYEYDKIPIKEWNLLSWDSFIETEILREAVFKDDNTFEITLNGEPFKIENWVNQYRYNTLEVGKYLHHSSSGKKAYIGLLFEFRPKSEKKQSSSFSCRFETLELMGRKKEKNEFGKLASFPQLAEFIQQKITESKTWRIKRQSRKGKLYNLDFSFQDKESFLQKYKALINEMSGIVISAENNVEEIKPKNLS